MLPSLYLLSLFLISNSAASVLQPRQQRSQCSLAQFDRCGPADQAYGTASTCNSTITRTTEPEFYGLQCSRNPALARSLDPQACQAAQEDICNRLTDAHVIKDRWIWTNPAFIGCSLGFWLPSGNGSDAAFAPNYDRCMEGIFGPMTTLCTKPSWNNIGAVNLAALPDSTSSGTPVNPYYPSYVIAPVQLTTYA